MLEILVLLGLGAASPPAAAKNMPQPPSDVAQPVSGFTWEIRVQDVIKQKTETYRVIGQRRWSFASFSCSVEPQPASRDGAWLTQDISLTCESGSVIAVTGATCATMTRENQSRHLAAEGKMHLSFAVTTNNGAAVLFESRCLEPKS
jgi:hypothetical protein